MCKINPPTSAAYLANSQNYLWNSPDESKNLEGSFDTTLDPYYSNTNRLLRYDDIFSLGLTTTNNEENKFELSECKSNGAVSPFSEDFLSSNDTVTSISKIEEEKNPKRQLAENEEDTALMRKRSKNNDAARRCREKRRSTLQAAQDKAALLEQEKLELSIKCALLEKEKAAWREQELEMRMEIERLRAF